MYGMLLYYYCLSFVFVDQLAKSLIFLSLFNRYLTLRALIGATACYFTFPISNLTIGPRLGFFPTCLFLFWVTFKVFFFLFCFPF